LWLWSLLCGFELFSLIGFGFLTHSDECYLVFDYCQRSLLQLSSGDVIPQLPPKDINQAGKYIMFMSLLENCIGKPIDLVSSARRSTNFQLLTAFSHADPLMSIRDRTPTLAASNCAADF
jgi:hypothetical protein